MMVGSPGGNAAEFEEGREEKVVVQLQRSAHRVVVHGDVAGETTTPIKTTHVRS